MLEQLAYILPEVSAYEAGLLDFLLRGELTITTGDQIAVSGKGLGAGNVEILVEDDRGVRKSIASVAATGAEQLAQVAAPGGGGSAGARVVAVFRGTDAAGEPIVAVGAMPLGR